MLTQFPSLPEPIPIERPSQDETDLEYKECQSIIQILASTDKGHATRYTLAQKMGLTQMLVQHYAEILKARGLLLISGNSSDGSGYDLTPKGVSYALKNGWATSNGG